MPVPAVTYVSPSSGPLGGGTSVTISGANFTAATAVYFGTVAASSFTIVSPTEITVVSPAGLQAGIVDVTVTTPGGTSPTSSADQFQYSSGGNAPIRFSRGGLLPVLAPGREAAGASPIQLSAAEAATALALGMPLIPARSAGPSLLTADASNTNRLLPRSNDWVFGQWRPEGVSSALEPSLSAEFTELRTWLPALPDFDGPISWSDLDLVLARWRTKAAWLLY